MDMQDEFDDDAAVHVSPLQGLAAWHGQEYITDEHVACSTRPSPPGLAITPSRRVSASHFLMAGIVLSMVSIGLVRVSNGRSEKIAESVSTQILSEEEAKWLNDKFVHSSAAITGADNHVGEDGINRPPNHRMQPSVCPPGSFCPRGAKSPILCPHGFHCPEGSSSPVQCQSGMFCPEGSKEAKVCGGGHFCPAGSSRELPCPPQHYCALGSDENGPVGCPEGTYCPPKTEYPVDCPAAHFCPAKSNKGLPCPAQFFCPTKTSLPTLCPAGHYCLPKTDVPPECPGGTFCPEGSELPEPCPSGAYCKEGSTRWIQCPPSYFCPAQSSAPKTCPRGSYCPEGSSNFIPCPKGYNCPEGTAVPTKRVKKRNGDGSGSSGDDDDSYYDGDDYDDGSGYEYQDDGNDANHDWCYWCSISPTPAPTVAMANASSVRLYVEFPSNIGSDDDFFFFEEDTKARGLVWSQPQSTAPITGFEIQFLERIVTEGAYERSYQADEDSILPATLWVRSWEALEFEVEGISSTEESPTFYAYTLPELLRIYTGDDSKITYLLLDFEEAYLVRIRAENEGGVGEWSPVQTVDFAVDSWIYEASEMYDPENGGANSWMMDAHALQISEKIKVLEDNAADIRVEESRSGERHRTGHSHNARKANLGSDISEVRKSATKFAEAMGIFRSMSLSASLMGLIIGLGYVYGGRNFLTGGDDDTSDQESDGSRNRNSRPRYPLQESEGAGRQLPYGTNF